MITVSWEVSIQLTFQEKLQQYYSACCLLFRYFHGVSQAGYITEPWHAKTNKICMSPAKITCKISLGILPVWSETSVWAKWITVDQFFLPMDSGDFDLTELMPRLIRVFSWRTTTLLVFLCCGTYDCCTWPYSWKRILGRACHSVLSHHSTSLRCCHTKCE